MPSTELRGLAQTVLGAIDPSELGPTTTHEHLYIDFSFMYRHPRDSLSDLADAPITMENLGWIRHNHYSNHANLQLMDVDTAISEAALYKKVGGGTIVDVTTIGIGRNATALERISRESGVHVVMGAGFYVDAVLPDDMHERTVDIVAQRIIDDIRNGVDGTGIKAGIIGEVGCTWPLTDNERLSLRASAQAQQETGAAILIHPGRHPDAPAEILQVLADGGADIERVIIGHLDRTVFDMERLREIAASGCYLEWDLFGSEGSYYPLADLDMPSDAQRLDYIMRMCDEGYAGKIVVGQDICTNHRLTRYGGHGYGHIMENIVPRMRRKGFAEGDIDAITVRNPADVLTFI
ncbi:MAG: phosphotriesterase-related protein [Chloroflexi bacterium]|nr:phosphotriesterase-related protein [Chloroflexota bacterium]